MRFNYVAYTLELGLVKGTVEARGQADARVLILRQGHRPLRVVPARRPPAVDDLFPSLFQVKKTELVLFARQLATMLISGGNLLRALEMLRRETRAGGMKRIMEAIHTTLDEGGSLSNALAEHPRVFSPLFISVVEVGEHTGRLGPALEQIADILEKEQEAKQKAVKTMMYPLAIIGLSVCTLGVLMTVAMPPMLKIFGQMEADIPVMTRIMVALVGAITGNYREIFLAAVAMAALFVLMGHSPRARLRMDGALARAPLIGPVIVDGELARLARTLAMLLDADVSLSSGLQLGITGCKNLALKRAFEDALEHMINGHRLAEGLERHSVVPPLFLELVWMGEESNSLKRAMSDAADGYQKQLDRRLNNLLGFLEPASTVVVGGIVGLIAFSMFVPIYSGLNAIE